MMHFLSFDKYKISVCVMMLAAMSLTACRGRLDETTEAVTESSREADETAAEGDTSAETAETETLSDETYAGTVAALEAAEDESEYFGIMNATVLQINGKQGESNTVYSFKDKNDPDNCWSFTGLEIGDIETELAAGQDVVILFNGDIINDSENVSFMVILPDGQFTMKRAEGKTVNNMMSTFTVETSSGETLQFMKDNCRMDANVLSADSGDRVIVYYADGGNEYGNYPLRVFKGNE